MSLLAVLLAQALDLSVVGVVWSGKPDLCAAVVRAAGRTRVIGVGESVGGGRVISISQSGLVIDVAGERLELRLRGETVPAGQGLLPGGVAPPATPPAEATAEVPGVRSLSRREVDSRLQTEIPRILSETTLFPASEDGKVVGYTLTRIPDGTLLSDVGLRAGDVLTSINDTPVTSLATLIALYPKLSGLPQLRATVLRSGQPVSLILNIK
jgi:general secretion pathway protein C